MRLLVLHFAAGLLVAAASTAGAQETPSEGRQPLPTDIERTLKLRGREFLHPGDPLHLVGAPEGDARFQDRTPLLLTDVRSAAPVDLERLHEAKLALYGGAPPPRDRSLALRVPPPTPAVQRPDRSADPVAPAGPGPATAIFIGSLIVLGLYLRRIAAEEEERALQR